MRFSRLRGTSAIAPKPKNKEAVSKIRAWLWPQSTEGRSTRLTQYKDIGMFVGAIALVWIFEEQIRGALEITADDIQKLGIQEARYAM